MCQHASLPRALPPVPPLCCVILASEALWDFSSPMQGEKYCFTCQRKGAPRGFLKSIPVYVQKRQMPPLLNSSSVLQLLFNAPKESTELCPLQIQSDSRDHNTVSSHLCDRILALLSFNQGNGRKFYRE